MNCLETMISKACDEMARLQDENRFLRGEMERFRSTIETMRSGSRNVPASKTAVQIDEIGATALSRPEAPVVADCAPTAAATKRLTS